jgi:hypothetical protein
VCDGRPRRLESDGGNDGPFSGGDILVVGQRVRVVGVTKFSGRVFLTKLKCRCFVMKSVVY